MGKREREEKSELKATIVFDSFGIQTKKTSEILKFGVCWRVIKNKIKKEKQLVMMMIIFDY